MLTTYDPRAATHFAVVDPVTGRTYLSTGDPARACDAAETVARHTLHGCAAVVEVPTCNN